LDHFLTQAINSEKDKRITPEHLIDLQALAEKQRVAIQEINKEEYRMQIVSAGTIGSLDHFLTQAINSEKDKRITPEHLIDLQALAEKQRVAIQEINKEPVTEEGIR
ncbi:hypothetical protein KA111_02225, partial [Candidatus Woesebacteria bacterium]|nr:hypothetical protein [Candidatus Woesebacteria bacterium]